MDIQNLINEVERYAASIGRSPDYVCRKATNHPLLFQRLLRRLEKTEADAALIRKFMEVHSRQSQGKHGNADTTFQDGASK